jgi:hypothetical protein
VLGFQDETWWPRLALPSVSAWGEQPLRLVQREADKGDPDPKALSCYGLLRGDTGGMLLRFVAGRPVSQVTEDYLAWVCERLAAEGKKALLLVWDNASWHVSQRVRSWIKGAQPPGQGRRRGADHRLPAAGQGPVAESDRAEVGPRQESGRGARAKADGPRNQQTGM